MKQLLSILLVLTLLLGAVPGVAQDAPVAPDAVVPADPASENEDGIVFDPSEEVQLDDIAGAYTDAAESFKKIGDMTNILLIGMDTRPGQKTGRSDSMILFTLDAKHNCIKMTSFLRDLYVEIPGHKSNRLNAAIVYGGPELLKETLRQNFGVEVDYYVGVNFSLLASVIDQLGGLTLTVEKRYVPRINAIIDWDNDVLGISHDDGKLVVSDDVFDEDGKADLLLTGKQAEAWSRFRYGVPGDGDFDRSDRQRELILVAMKKLQSMSMSELVQLAIANIGNVVTDMSVVDLMQIAPAAFELRNSEVRQLLIPIKGKYKDAIVSKMAVYLPNRVANMNAFTEFILAE
ncbi:MAG: LCP family protein [Clostridia bacterium]